jgi:hypothetical protein
LKPELKEKEHLAPYKQYKKYKMKFLPFRLYLWYWLPLLLLENERLNSPLTSHDAPCKTGGSTGLPLCSLWSAQNNSMKEWGNWSPSQFVGHHLLRQYQKSPISLQNNTTWRVAHASATTGSTKRKWGELRTATTNPLLSRVIIPSLIQPWFLSIAAFQLTLTVPDWGACQEIVGLFWWGSIPSASMVFTLRNSSNETLDSPRTTLGCLNSPPLGAEPAFRLWGGQIEKKKKEKKEERVKFIIIIILFF